MVEFQVHGNTIILNRILSLLISKGARIAEPGEFTKRAFLNGKIDLVQAESVANLIHSTTNFATKKSLENLSGGFSKKIFEWKKIITKFLAEVEANLDFYDKDDLPIFDLPENKKILEEVLEEIEKTISTYKIGKILEQGAKVVLAGLPNSGKSSLFNFFVGKEKAIVTNIPGTTRDTIESKIDLFGLPIILVDTAGINENSSDPIENFGIAKSKEEISFSDVVLWVLDQENFLDSMKIFETLKLSIKNFIFVINKIDNEDFSFKKDVEKFFEEKKFSKNSISLISVKFQKNIEDLKRKIYEKLIGEDKISEESIIVSTERQKEKLFEIFSSLNLAKKEKNLELIAENLKIALDEISELLGEKFKPDILDSVFHNFCIGK